MTENTLTPRPARPRGVGEKEWANNLSGPGWFSGLAPERSREEQLTGPDGAVLFRFREILVHTQDHEWAQKTLAGLSHKDLWRNDETGASIALVRFLKGSGIPTRHAHGSNQFMFCLSGRYTYIPTGLTLTAGSFYWNPKGSLHGPTRAEEESVLLEVYDGPHYASLPDWYTDPRDAR